MLHFSNISIKDVLRNTADDVTTLLDKKPKVSQRSQSALPSLWEKQTRPVPFCS